MKNYTSAPNNTDFQRPDYSFPLYDLDQNSGSLVPFNSMEENGSFSGVEVSDDFVCEYNSTPYSPSENVVDAYTQNFDAYDYNNQYTYYGCNDTFQNEGNDLSSPNYDTNYYRGEFSSVEQLETESEIDDSLYQGEQEQSVDYEYQTNQQYYDGQTDGQYYDYQTYDGQTDGWYYGNQTVQSHYDNQTVQSHYDNYAEYQDYEYPINQSYNTDQDNLDENEEVGEELEESEEELNGNFVQENDENNEVDIEESVTQETDEEDNQHIEPIETDEVEGEGHWSALRVICTIISSFLAFYCIVSVFVIILTFENRNTSNMPEEIRAEAHTVVVLPAKGETFQVMPTSTHVNESITGGEGTPMEPTENMEFTRSIQKVYPKNPLRNLTPAMQLIRAENERVIGRIEIPNVIDEYIMHFNNTYYLVHDAKGDSSRRGAVYMDESCTLKKPTENLLLRGLGSSNMHVLSPLFKFQTEGELFATQNSILNLTTLYEEERYILFSIIITDSNVDDPTHFDFDSKTTFESDAEMLEYVDEVKSKSIYPFQTSVSADDRLLTLSTVSMDIDNIPNLVLFYRMMREGE